MAASVLLVPDDAYSYSAILAIELGIQLARVGARASVLGSERLAIAPHDHLGVGTAESSRGRVVYVGSPPLAALLGLRRPLAVVQLSTPDPTGLLPLRLARRCYFAGWTSLVTDPELRVRLMGRCQVLPPLGASSWKGKGAEPGSRRRVLVYAENPVAAAASCRTLLGNGVPASAIAVTGRPGESLPEGIDRLPLAPIVDLASGTELVVAPPDLEVVLDALRAGASVQLWHDADDGPSARRSAYLARRLASVSGLPLTLPRPRLAPASGAGNDEVAARLVRMLLDA